MPKRRKVTVARQGNLAETEGLTLDEKSDESDSDDSLDQESRASMQARLEVLEERIRNEKKELLNVHPVGEISGSLSLLGSLIAKMATEKAPISTASLQAEYDRSQEHSHIKLASFADSLKFLKGGSLVKWLPASVIHAPDENVYLQTDGPWEPVAEIVDSIRKEYVADHEEIAELRRKLSRQPPDPGVPDS